MYVAIWKQKKIPVHSEKQAQIGAPIFNRASTIIFVKYSDYSNIFLTKNTTEFPKHTGINNHAIKLKEGNQLFFGPINSLRPLELETLKIYIEINMANGFIELFKSFIEASIFFD